MKKSIFTNQGFYFGIIIFLVLLLLWNTYVVYLGSYIGLIQIIIQIVLLYLIFTKNPNSKIGLKFFSIVFLITASGLQIISAILYALIGEFTSVNVTKLSYSILYIVVGMIILSYTNKTVKISDNTLD